MDSPASWKLFFMRMPERAAGELHIEADRGWKVEPAVLPFQMKSTGEERQMSFTITPKDFGTEAGGPAHFRVFGVVGAARLDSRGAGDRL